MEIVDIFLGCLVGIITGIIPGLHVNTLLTFLGPSPWLIGVAVSHTFFDFIPSMLLGVPDEPTSVASLPGHRLVLKGIGKQGFIASVAGGLVATLVLPLVLLVFILFPIKEMLPLVLGLSIFVLIATSKRKLIALAIILSSFLLFLISRNSMPQTSLFFSYFTGLFGVPTLLNAILRDTNIPPQDGDARIRIGLFDSILSSLGGLVAGIFPGVTSGISAIMIDSAFPKGDLKRMFVFGGINTVYVISTFLAIWVVGRPRSGIAIALKDLGFKAVPMLIMAVSISAVLALYIGRAIFELFSRLPIRNVNKTVLLCLFLASAILGIKPFLLFLGASSLGIIAYNLGMKRTLGMGFLLIPSLLYQLGFYF